MLTARLDGGALVARRPESRRKMTGGRAKSRDPFRPPRLRSLPLPPRSQPQMSTRRVLDFSRQLRSPSPSSGVPAAVSDHELADNSQYWIGEAHFSISRGHANAGQADKAKEELERAVQEFRKVIANYPRGDKAPTALYKEALALLELKQPGVGQARLQYLVDNFPQAEETPLARERLAALKTGG